MALALVGKADVFMTTTDTLMQEGGEKALIEISLELYPLKNQREHA